MNSTYWLNKVMDTMYTNGTNEFWLGLSSTLPNNDGTGVTEPTGDDYARVKIMEFSAPLNGTVTNVDELRFARSASVWFPSETKATYWVLFDGSGADANLLSAGELSDPKTVESSTVVAFEAETLGITLADYIAEVV